MSDRGERRGKGIAKGGGRKIKEEKRIEEGIK